MDPNTEVQEQLNNCGKLVAKLEELRTQSPRDSNLFEMATDALVMARKSKVFISNMASKTE
jgi:2-methylaconitate cis-trans-isomerase PrpF